MARIYYQKNTSRRVAVDKQISMKKLLGGSRDTSDSFIKSMLFPEKSESDISKANPKKESKTEHEGTKTSESGDDKNSTASDTAKEFQNSERRKQVPFTPEEDSFIRKGIQKHGFGHWTAILRSFEDNFGSSRTVDSIKKRAEKLFGEQK